MNRSLLPLAVGALLVLPTAATAKTYTPPPPPTCEDGKREPKKGECPPAPTPPPEVTPSPVIPSAPEPENPDPDPGVEAPPAAPPLTSAVDPVPPPPATVEPVTPVVITMPVEPCPLALRNVYRTGAGSRWVRLAVARGCVAPRKASPRVTCEDVPQGAGRAWFNGSRLGFSCPLPERRRRGPAPIPAVAGERR